MEEQTTLPKLRRDERTDSGIRILYEDNHLLVVEKPVNLPVQADSSGDDDLLTLLKAYIRARYEKPGEVYLGLVHRLESINAFVACAHPDEDCHAHGITVDPVSGLRVGGSDPRSDGAAIGY